MDTDSRWLFSSDRTPFACPRRPPRCPVKTLGAVAGGEPAGGIFAEVSAGAGEAEAKVDMGMLVDERIDGAGGFGVT